MIAYRTVQMIDHAETGICNQTLRRMRRLSLREVARRMGLSAPFVSDLERGRRNWTEDLDERYARALKRKR